LRNNIPVSFNIRVMMNNNKRPRADWSAEELERILKSEKFLPYSIIPFFGTFFLKGACRDTEDVVNR